MDTEKINEEICEKAVYRTGETIFNSTKDTFIGYQNDVLDGVANGKSRNLKDSFNKFCAETFTFFVKDIASDVLKVPETVFNETEYWKVMNLTTISDYSTYAEKKFFKDYGASVKEFCIKMYRLRKIFVTKDNMYLIKDLLLDDMFYAESGYTLRKSNDCYWVTNLSPKLTIPQILKIMSVSVLKK